MTTTAQPTTSCCAASCELGPFVRNNYWYGKLMLPQDFTDEQSYFREKIRHHNMRLHGTGVVCGLLVQQDATPGCRDRLVTITPGSALDCCGNEIVVREADRFDFSELPAVRAIDLTDEATHDLRICLRYRECATEPVPVLYDECGCDDGRCLPNRILESYEVDVVIDPPATPATWNGPALVRGTDLGFVNASHVRASGGAVLVSAGQTVYNVDSATRATVASHDVGGPVHATELSSDGDHVFVVHDDTSAAVTLTVLKLADLSVVNTAAVPGGQTPVTAAVGSDGRLVLALSAAKTLLRYEPDLTSATPTAPATIAVPAGRGLVALSADAGTAYLAAASGSGAANPTQIDVVDLPAAAVGPAIKALPAGAEPNLLLLDGASLIVPTSDGQCYAISVPAGTLAGKVALPIAPFAAVGSPWAYLLDSSGGMSRVRPVRLAGIAASSQSAVGPASGLAGDAHDIAVDETGGRIYVAYTLSAAEPGGIAVFDLIGGTCRDGWEELPTCPACDEPDCVTLATIHGYRPGFKVLDAAEPPSEPAEDLAHSIARIDNRDGRHVLRSTALLGETIECLLDCCEQSGGTGLQGPAGADGATGPTGPRGPAGPGLEAGLTQIAGISWPHAKDMTVDQLRTVVRFPGTPQEQRLHGVTVMFTDTVQVAAIDSRHVFQVDAPNVAFPQGAEFGFDCRCPIVGEVFPVVAQLDANGQFVQADVIDPPTDADAVSFVFNARFVKQALVNPDRMPDDLWVKVRGDFVVDKNGKAVDAEFARAEFPTGDRPAGSKHGSQGGTFESWFRPIRDNN
jgi:hypothetical protein